MGKLLDFYEDTGKERVGAILKDGSVYEFENVHPEPYEAFDVAPEELIRLDDEMKATFHTHPKFTSNLSAEDYQAFTNWPDLIHIIIGNDGPSAYIVENGKVLNASESDLAWLSKKDLL
ncbi:hypothetical protein [Kiloniella sp.]|uniref:hypothetical protein n=1 Tax=Kiloniella sp. TaxID=1938587 RepID=UPI003B012B78